MYPVDWKQVVFAVAVMVILAGAIQAQEVPGATVETPPGIAQIQEDNRRLRDEMDQLRRQFDTFQAEEQSRLDARETREIQQVVDELLQASGARRSSLQDGLIAGWSDHFFLASPNGRFKLQIDGHLQFRYLYRYASEGINEPSPQDSNDRHRQGFEIPRSKLTLSGHVFNDDLTWLLRTDATRNEQGLVNGLFFLRDAWVRYRLDNEWSVRAGQFKLGFNREELVSSQYQLAVERSLVNENMNLGRSQGIELTRNRGNVQWQLTWSDGASEPIEGFNLLQSGTFGNDEPSEVNQDAMSPDTEYAFTVRREKLLAGRWDQFRDMTSPMGDSYGLLFGMGMHFEKGESMNQPTPGRDESRFYTATFDLSAEWGGANLYSAFHFNYIDSFFTDQYYIKGIVLQGGVYFSPKWEGFARWEYGWWDSKREENNFGDTLADLHALTLGVNYYVEGHDMKWTTDIGFGVDEIDMPWASDIAGWGVDQDESGGQVVIRTQFQLQF